MPPKETKSNTDSESNPLSVMYGKAKQVTVKLRPTIKKITFILSFKK